MTTVGLILYDLLKRTHVRKTLRFLQESQHWSLEELERLQAEKLERLLEGVRAEVPFYGESGNQGVRESGHWTMERFGDWPILDRIMVMEAGDRLLSDKINLKKCKVSRTGGTTGPPLRLYRDTETRSWALAAYYRFYEWMGIEPGMPEVELWGSTEIRNLNSERRNLKSTQTPTPLSSRAEPRGNTQHPPRTPNPEPRTSLFARLSNFRSYNAFSFNDTYLAEVVNNIQKFQPKLIRGYLSAILLLADHIKRNNIKDIRPLAVSCTAETLFPEYRKKIEEVFQAPLFDQYGCGECNSIAFECSEHNGMHISMEHCILESDENNNLIVTNLDNHSQPFIRYRNGDSGIIDHTPCACGYAGPRITQLHGRASENIIRKDGASVNGVFFANLLDQAGFINSDKMLRFQVVQHREGEIEFKAEVKPGTRSRIPGAGNGEMKNVDFKKLEDCLMPFFNKVVISQHKFLDPGPGGKFRYIVSNL
jgi:phenylacetate-CoA ligase